MKLNQRRREILSLLKQAQEEGNRWVKADPFDPRPIRWLVHAGLVDERSDAISITDLGLKALADNAPFLEESNGHIVIPPAIVRDLDNSPDSTPPSNHTGDCGECNSNCVYRQAFDILAARIPEARQLVFALQSIQGKMKE